MFKKLLIMAAILLSIPAHSEPITLTKDNLVSINSQVDSRSVTEASIAIQKLNASESKDPIYLVLNTPGGSVFDGIEFIRYAKSSRRPVHTITLFAASMGFQIVEALPGTRYIAESGVLMSHRAATGGLSGQFPGELNVRLDFLGEVTRELDEGVAKRAGMSLKQYQDLIHDEYYATPEKAIKGKFADKKAEVKCDDSLNGTYLISVPTPFGTVNVEFAKCPLITGVVSAGFQKPSDLNKEKDALEVFTVQNKNATK